MRNISVIIPVYNTAEYLPKCLDSLLGQSLLPMEIILVNDGSTDASSDICQRYAQREPKLIRVIQQENRGAAAARNAGLNASRGELLSFVDSDDSLSPDFLETLSSLMEQYQADMACCEMLVEREDGSTYCRNENPSQVLCWPTQEALIELCSYRYLYASFCNALFRREAIGSLRFPEGQRSEDYALLYQVIARCEKVVYTASPLYHYLQRPHSTSRTASVGMEPMEISLRQLAFFRECFPDIAWAAESDCVFAHLGIMTSYLRNGANCPKALEKQLRSVCRRHLRSVWKHPKLPPVKKAQAAVFCYFPALYKAIIKRTEHR